MAYLLNRHIAEHVPINFNKCRMVLWAMMLMMTEDDDDDDDDAYDDDDDDDNDNDDVENREKHKLQ